MKPRDIALKALNRPPFERSFPEHFLDAAFSRDPSMDPRDRALAVHLVQGVLRRQLYLDWVIGSAVRFPFEKIELRVLNILRLALYQIHFMDRIPHSAAVNEAVRQARTKGKRHVASFVNGILREICRRKDRGRLVEDTGPNPQQALSRIHSYPEWLVRLWADEMGLGETEALLAAGNRVPELTVRVNTLKIRQSELINRLRAEGVQARPTAVAPQGLRLHLGNRPLSRLNAFQQGLFQVQGEAAQICSHILSPRPRDFVLDLCAGLGGKSTHLAELMGGAGRIIALDSHWDRLVRLQESANRLGIHSVQAVAADASRPLNLFRRHSFDKILVDAPCTGLGVISKHPGIKWLRQPEDLERSASLQERILCAAGEQLRPGGLLLYVTCTLCRRENETVIARFLAGRGDMHLEDIRNYLPEWGRSLVNENGFFKTLPHRHSMEGFFAALLRHNTRE